MMKRTVTMVAHASERKMWMIRSSVGLFLFSSVVIVRKKCIGSHKIIIIALLMCRRRWSSNELSQTGCESIMRTLKLSQNLSLRVWYYGKFGPLYSGGSGSQINFLKKVGVS